MALERERKYLLIKDRFDPSDGFTKKTIEQGYVMIEGDAHTRVRIIDEKEGRITFKQRLNDIDINEFEFPVSLVDAKSLMLSTNRVLLKTRYSKTVEGVNIDVDIYPSGMSVVELEYSTETLPISLIPNYCGEEVTGDKTYSNMHIALINSGKTAKELYEDAKNVLEDSSLLTEVPVIEVERELKTTLTESEVSFAFSTVFSDVNSLGFMKAELNDLLYNRDYWFLNPPKTNWYANLINYLDSIGFDTKKITMNPEYFR